MGSSWNRCHTNINMRWARGYFPRTGEILSWKRGTYARIKTDDPRTDEQTSEERLRVVVFVDEDVAVVLENSLNRLCSKMHDVSG